MALTEAAIGSGLTGALLLGAAAHLRAGEAPAGEGPGVILRLEAAVLSATVAVALAIALLLSCLTPHPRLRRQPPRTPRQPVSAIRSPTC